MSKVIRPLLSLGAHGTVGNTLTYSQGIGDTTVRTKPLPHDRNTLLQQYQRWRHQDAGWYWRSLTDAQKFAYRTIASHRHIPIYAAFLRDYLKNTPDLFGLWPLDRDADGLAVDLSPNVNHGTIVGAIQSPGKIDHGFYFDGINDQINCGMATNIDVQTFTISGFIYPSTFAGNTALISQLSFAAGKGGWAFLRMGNKVAIWILQSGAWFTAYSPAMPSINTWYFVHGTYDKINIKAYLDNAPFTPVACSWDIWPTNKPLRIGVRSDAPGAYKYQGRIDHLQLNSRILTQAHTLALAQRHYP